MSMKSIGFMCFFIGFRILDSLLHQHSQITDYWTCMVRLVVVRALSIWVVSNEVASHCVLRGWDPLPLPFLSPSHSVTACHVKYKIKHIRMKWTAPIYDWEKSRTSRVRRT